LRSNPRAALEAIGLLPDAEIDIADAALQLGRVDAPEADWLAARASLSELARDAAALAANLPVDDVSRRAAGLAGLIAGDHRYGGDAETYDDPANANLIRVTERRRGLPVAIGIVWLHAARAAGWVADGVDFPSHFLVRLEGPDPSAAESRLLLDVFAGGKVLNARDLRALVKATEGPKSELRPEAVQPMNTRGVLLRLQNNLKVRRLRDGRLAEALTGVEDMLRIAPDEATLWREAALINQRLDRVAAALRCFERFLDLVPRGDAAARARAAMDELRTRLN
jgi:regulator of sirC expression with transglutaminase-like and TPR domain